MTPSIYLVAVIEFLTVDTVDYSLSLQTSLVLDSSASAVVVSQSVEPLARSLR